MLHVSAVIPTYNGSHLLQKHLPAVLRSLRSGDEIVIVDDASTDDTVAFLTKKYQLEFLREGLYQAVDEVENKRVVITVRILQKNSRFAVAANSGVQLAQHPYIFLLNNDVSPQADALDYLVTHFEDKSVFAVGCKEYEGSQSGSISGKNKLWFERGLFMHAKKTPLTSGSTAWVSGGSGLFDREKWILLGGFDKRFYPAYWEDIDLSFRARKRGWKVLFEEKAIVYHKHESTNQTVFGATQVSRMSLRNGVLFTLKHSTFWQFIQFIIWRPYWLVKTAWL